MIFIEKIGIIILLLYHAISEVFAAISEILLLLLIRKQAIYFAIIR